MCSAFLHMGSRSRRTTSSLRDLASPEGRDAWGSRNTREAFLWNRFNPRDSWRYRGIPPDHAIRDYCTDLPNQVGASLCPEIVDDGFPTRGWHRCRDFNRTSPCRQELGHDRNVADEIQVSPLKKGCSVVA